MATANRRHQTWQSTRLHRLLVEEGHITEEQLAEALRIQSESGREKVPLETILVNNGYVTAETVVKVIGELLGYPFVDLNQVNDLEHYAKFIPRDLCYRFHCIAFGEDDNGIHVAFADPSDLEAKDFIRRSIQNKIVAYIAVPEDITKCLNDAFRHQLTAVELVGDFDDESTESIEDALVEDVPVVRFVNDMLERAVQLDASDIHIEPREDRTVIRFRIDGVLQVISQPPKKSHEAIVARIKLLGGMDVAQRREPQDGRVRRNILGRPVDIRISSLPTIHGEKLVLRLLDQQRALIGIDALGMTESDIGKASALLKEPYGLILVCGPTGSGKSTTLYAFLNQKLSPGINIVSLEDPVEYRLDGVSQVQVDARTGLTFATGLRSILRQDPDVILVGEIRDQETAQLCVDASLTGHLVFSTLHTNDSVGAVTRLVNTGVEPFLIASSLLGVIAQRLVRRLCLHCREVYQPTEHERKYFGFTDRQLRLYRAKEGGCVRCNGTGYRGRIGVYEILMVDDKIRQMIVDRASEAEIKAYALDNGLTTLTQAAKRLVEEGITSIEELLRCVQTRL